MHRKEFNRVWLTSSYWEMKLYRIILPVRDIEKASAFYGHIFNLSGKRVSSGRHYFDLEGTILAVYDPIADGDDAGKEWVFHEHQFIYISTTNLEAVHEKFLESDSEYVEENIKTRPWGERSFYVHDPFGNLLCFVDKNTVFTG